MSAKAASGLVYLFGDAEIVQVEPFELHVVAQTPTTITFGWSAVDGAVGYRFSREGYVKADGSPRYSTSFDTDRLTVKFAKGSAWYKVEALGVLDSAVYPPQTPKSSARISFANLTI